MQSETAPPETTVPADQGRSGEGAGSIIPHLQEVNCSSTPEQPGGAQETPVASPS